MKKSLSLLTAAVLAAAPAAAADVPTVAPSSTPQVIQVSPAETQPPAPLTFRERLRRLFRPHRNATPEQAAPTRLAPVASDRYNPLPATPQTLAVSKDLDGVGHEKDYSWITGRLAHVPGEPGRLLIRYAGPNEMDTYGGQMLLAPNAELKKYHEGDLVCVYGKVTTPLRSAKNGAHATYQATQVYLIPAKATSR